MNFYLHENLFTFQSKKKKKKIIFVGRSSLPLLNRSGTYLRWQNVWDDTKYYNIKFTEDLFLTFFFKLFLAEFFNERVYLQPTSFFLFFTTNALKFKVHVKKLKTFHKFLQTFQKIQKTEVLFMRFHILRSPTTCLVILKFYTPILKFTNTQKLKSTKKSSDYFAKKELMPFYFLTLKKDHISGQTCFNQNF